MSQDSDPNGANEPVAAPTTESGEPFVPCRAITSIKLAGAPWRFNHLSAARTGSELCAPRAQLSQPTQGSGPLGDSEPAFVSALSLLLGYCYESDKNPVEAFTINEAFEDISLTIVHQLTPPTKWHAKGS
jgi:hypothetical protein